MENNKLIEEILSEFLQKTQERRIPWALINPNAVRWTKQSPQQVTIVTLQKQMTTISGSPTTLKENIVLTIQNPQATIIQINSSTEPSLKDLLSSLFKEAMISANDKTIETLRNLLKGI